MTIQMSSDCDDAERGFALHLLAESEREAATEAITMSDAWLLRWGRRLPPAAAPALLCAVADRYREFIDEATEAEGLTSKAIHEAVYAMYTHKLANQRFNAQLIQEQLVELLAAKVKDLGLPDELVSAIRKAIDRGEL